MEKCVLCEDWLYKTFGVRDRKDRIFCGKCHNGSPKEQKEELIDLAVHRAVTIALARRVDELVQEVNRLNSRVEDLDRYRED